jgi:hypothetical protein
MSEINYFKIFFTMHDDVATNARCDMLIGCYVSYLHV